MEVLVFGAVILGMAVVAILILTLGFAAVVAILILTLGFAVVLKLLGWILDL